VETRVADGRFAELPELGCISGTTVNGRCRRWLGCGGGTYTFERRI